MNVAFIVFNRPDLTARVFAEIRKAQPSHLFIIADGPRHDQDALKCARVREIVQSVDWPCELRTNFSETNLGCRVRIQSGLDWLFDQVEEAIILEDDCMPHPSFFPFCVELLERYRDTRRIATIAGTTEGVRPNTMHSYTFSRRPMSWGWATWRRYWRDVYDRDMTGWPANWWLRKSCPDRRVRKFWRDRFNSMKNGEVDTWDFQSMYTIWRADMLNIIPAQNLTSNIGYYADPTHPTEFEHPMAELPLGDCDFPLSHPTEIKRDIDYDERLDRALIDIYHVPLYLRLSWWASGHVPEPIWRVARKLKTAVKRA